MKKNKNIFTEYLFLFAMCSPVKFELINFEPESNSTIIFQFEGDLFSVFKNEIA